LSNPWPKSSALPRSAAAVLAALHLDDPRLEGLAALEDGGWRAALDYCDRARLTLPLRDAARTAMPQWVRERTDGDAAKNRIRLRDIEGLYMQISCWLESAGIEFLALKGITHNGLFGGPSERRAQYDIDLYAPRETVETARDALIAQGYEPLPGMDDFPTDHLPALIRKTGWQWAGDYFDTAIPLTVELHFQFWNQRTERLSASGNEEFWTRRLKREIAGMRLPVLSSPDAIAYAALHLLKHLLRGSVNAFHAYEIASLLDARADDDALWTAWRALHSPGLRRLEAVSFRLAWEWFGGRLPEAVEEEVQRLPVTTQSWFEVFALSPAAAGVRTNKDELWLHLSLLESKLDALSVARRRLLPGNLPPLADTAYLSATKITWRVRAQRALRYARYTASRLRHHAWALPQTGVSGARWWWHTNSLGRQFWIFLASAVAFNFALFIFVLLYNLFLMDMGFREDFIGVVNGAARVGSVAGTLPAAFIATRFGLRRSLAAVIVLTAIVEVLRAVIGARLPLAGLAFASGCIFSVWAVILAPLIAASVEEKRRPTAFSVFFASMFATGILGNWIGGRLPLWMGGKQTVLLASAALSGMAVFPALRLKEHLGFASKGGGALRGIRETFRLSGRFLARYLAAFALWHLATGAFNPFNNVYFRKLGFADSQIGSVLSGAQLVQLAAVLAAPAVVRRFGLRSGIVWMMAATAVALSGLAAQPLGGAAVAAYTIYMSFQWMSEPGLNTLLMNHIPERGRSGASAVNFLVAFSGQALAAFAAGAWMTQFGYGPVLAGAAALALAAAVLFRILL
jgi:MFS family permease